jgi:hypothetical protein
MCIASWSTRSRRHADAAAPGSDQPPTHRIIPVPMRPSALTTPTPCCVRYYAHLTEQQMATVLGVATGTVKSRLSRALTALADDPSLEELRGTR